MSINFNEDMNHETAAKLEELFSDKLAAKDSRTALINSFERINSEELSDLARIAKQPVTLETHDQGEIKTMSDGTRYEVTPKGWRKLPS